MRFVWSAKKTIFERLVQYLSIDVHYFWITISAGNPRILLLTLYDTRHYPCIPDKAVPLGSPNASMLSARSQDSQLKTAFSSASTTPLG